MQGLFDLSKWLLFKRGKHLFKQCYDNSLSLELPTIHNFKGASNYFYYLNRYVLLDYYE